MKTASGRRRSTFAAELGIGRRSLVPMGGRLASTTGGGSWLSRRSHLLGGVRS